MINLWAIPWKTVFLYLGIAIVSVLLSALLTYAILDFWKGKTVVVDSECIGHHYRPSWTELKTERVRTGKKTHTRIYTVHHSEQFILTVTSPEGPRDFHVTHRTYMYYRDGSTVPVARRIGFYSKRCIASWLN